MLSSRLRTLDTDLGRLAVLLWPYTGPVMLLHSGKRLLQGILKVLVLPAGAPTRVFVHNSRGLRTLVHGDDYATVGSLDQLAWLEKQLTNRFEMKTTVVGHSSVSGVVAEGEILIELLERLAVVGTTNVTRDTLN